MVYQFFYAPSHALKSFFMKFLRLLSYLAIGIALLGSDFATAQTTVTIGTGTSSSSTRGPFQRADTNSSTVFSRWVQIYTASELAAAGVTNGVSLTQLNWELASSNVIIGTGNATLKIYVKNSNATAATSDTWANLITGSTQVVNDSYNITNNFPGANGWMPFVFSTPFMYTGGAIEIAVDWDCSQVSTPAFSGNGAIKFRWQSTAPDDLVVKRTASSSPPTSISDLKDERANIQMVYVGSVCAAPQNLNAANITTTSADLTWTASTSAVSYTWKVVAAGAGSGGTAIDGGTTTNTMVNTTLLTALTSYDLYVEADCGGTTGTSGFAGPYTFLSLPTTQSTVAIGTGTSSSSTRGPFQRSDTNSSTVFSRFVHIYTAAELATAGILPGATITELDWELASSNVMIGSGNANMKVYIKNSMATAATADTWANLIAGSSLVVDNDYNTTNNFPGANGWMPFAFSAPFIYTGGALEIAVDWDCSQVSTPAFSGDGSLKWRWESTAPDNLVVKKTASSGASTNISDLKNERANIQFAFVSPVCDKPTALNVTNITSTSADLLWNDSTADAYKWKIVLAGGSPTAAGVDSGTTVNTSASTAQLMAVTSYDLYVESDCGNIGTSNYEGPYNFKTLCAAIPITTITAAVTNVSCNGDADGEIDVTVTAGVPGYSFVWNNADTTEDISGLTAGTYTVSITDGDGCPYLDTVTVTEPPALMLTVTSIPDTANAGLGSASVAVTGGTPPYTFEWDGAMGSADTTGLTVGEYLVRITDANGCTDSANAVVSNLVGISPIDYVTNLSVSPNPTTGLATIELSLSQYAQIDVAIYTIRGERIEAVLNQNTSQLRHQVDLSAYADGMYFARFLIDGQAITKKIVLQR